MSWLGRKKMYSKTLKREWMDIFKANLSPLKKKNNTEGVKIVTESKIRRIGIMVKVFAIDPRDRGSIPGQIIPKT